jgi:formate hydrogenlyase transcriptional activator
MRLHSIQANVPADLVGGHEGPVEESPAGLVWRMQQPLLVSDLAEERRWPKVTGRMKEDGVDSFCFVPLTTAVRRLGAMGFLSLQKEAYGETDLEFLQQVGKQVAVAVDNVLNFASSEAAQQSLARERDWLSLVLEINNAVVSHLELRELLKAISACLRRVLPHDFAWFCLYDPATHQLRSHALDFPRHQDFVEAGDPIPLEGTPEGLAFTTQQTVLVRSLDLTEFPTEIMKRAEAEGLKSGCAVPLILHGRALGTLSVVSMQENAFTDDDAKLLSRIGAQVALAAANSMAYHEISLLKDKLAKEKLYLEEEIQTAYNFEEIVGDSRALKLVLKEVQTVAATDSTVLILGETGSGKELVARA